jgi:tetratricopeptide (TPR) repeat protein
VTTWDALPKVLAAVMRAKAGFMPSRTFACGNGQTRWLARVSLRIDGLIALTRLNPPLFRSHTATHKSAGKLFNPFFGAFAIAHLTPGSPERTPPPAKMPAQGTQKVALPRSMNLRPAAAAVKGELSECTFLLPTSGVGRLANPVRLKRRIFIQRMHTDSSMDERLPDIPSYSVHSRLGKGGMAEVYLATQESLHRKVAVKVLLSANDEAFSKRFIREGHIVASLHHPAIITIHDIDKLADGRYYLAMEFVGGGDLAQHKGEVFEPKRALEIVRQIAAGLAVVHDQGLIHRDIKPANILFRTDGSVVITDFGIAKALEMDSELTGLGVMVGSPAYSSPEQAQCLPLDIRTDIYSLGVILLEMLIGTNPFRGASYTQTVMNHVQMPPPSLPAHIGPYAPLLERMLAKNPNDRFADCRALLQALNELGEPEPQAEPEPAAEVREEQQDFTRIAPGLLDYPRTQAETEPAYRPRRSFRPLLLGLGGLLLIGAASGAGLYIQQQVEIADLLARAEQRLAEGTLVEPAQDNAAHFFNQALQLDENNEKARRGLQRVLEARLAGYRQLAEQRIAEVHLLEPENDSAVFYYRQMLDLAPGNAEALAGLSQVALIYADLSKKAYARGDYDLARAYSKHGLEAYPDSPELLALRDQQQKRGRSSPQPRPAPPVEEPAPVIEEPAEPSAIRRLWNRLF